MLSSEPSDQFREEKDFEELTQLENLSKEELTEKAKEDFNISEDEWKSNIEIEPMFSKDTVDDIANLDKYFSERLENALSGKVLVRTGKGEERWVQKNKAIAGSLIIKSCIGIIGTFANKPMLVSKVRVEDFNMQFEDAFKKVSNMIVMPQSYVDVNSIRTILKQFKDTFWNIGSILTMTGRNMESYFAALNRKYDETDSRIKSRLGD